MNEFEFLISQFLLFNNLNDKKIQLFLTSYFLKPF